MPARPRSLAPLLAAAAGLLALSNWLDWRPAGALDLAADAVAVLAVLAAALGLGLALLRRLEPAADLPPLARVVQGFALGSGALALAVVTLGLLGLLSRLAVLVLLAASGLGGLFEPRRLGAELASARDELRAAAGSGGRAALAVLALAAAALPVFPALLPAAFYDSLLYHLEAPASWLASGRLDAVPYNFHLNYPLNLSALYLAVDAVHPGAAVALLHVGFLVLSLLALLALGGALSPATGILAAVLFAVSPSVIESAAFPIADLAVVFWVLAATLAWLRWRERGTTGLLVLAGFHLGLAAGAKYTALFAGVLPIGLLTWIGGRGRPAAQRTRDGLVLAAAVVVTLAPWLLRNGVQTGNPIYPYFFAAREPFVAAHSFTSEVSQRLEGGSGAGWSSWAGNVAAGAGHLLRGGAGVAPYLGLALFLPLPFLLLLRPLRPTVTTLLGLGGLGLLGWDLTAHVTRYALPSVALLAVPAAEALRLGAGTRWGRVLIGLVAVTLGQNLLIGAVALDWGAVRNVLRGVETRSQYLGRTVSYYDAAEWANHNLGATDRILFVGEARGTYCRVPHVTVGTTRPLLALEVLREEPGRPIAESLRARGFTHLLVSWPEMRRIALEQSDYLGRTAAEQAALGELFANGCERVFGNDQVFVARLR